MSIDDAENRSKSLPETWYPFEFRGNTRDYFGIWIVNVLLGIVTLGIYSSWAKVRNKKYFYGQTFVDDHNFDYHATGLQLFIGKLIVGVALGILVIVQLISPILYLVVLLGLLMVLPAIIVRALRFNARVSSYRNVRFNFFGEFGDAFITYFLLPIASVFTLYLITPIVSRAANRYTLNNHSYGDRPFAFNSNLWPYYKPFLIVFAISILAFFVGLIPLGLSMTGKVAGDPNDPSRILISLLVVYAVLFLVIVPGALYYKACIRNVIFNNTVLDGVHQFESTVNPLRYVWILVSNAIAALFTIGLLVPWGRVRFSRYLAENTALISSASLDGYASTVRETEGVISSEYIDLEGFDVGIGI